MDELPTLERIFFANDGGEHAGDSCCLSLDRDFLATDAAKWAELRDQHMNALGVLASQAAAVGDHADGYWLARPLVFAAHHALELTFKAATVAERAKWPKGAGHDLVKLLIMDREVNG